MNLGTIPVSLSVRGLGLSKAFYETLGFMQFCSDPDHGNTIMLDQHVDKKP